MNDLEKLLRPFRSKRIPLRRHLDVFHPLALLCFRRTNSLLTMMPRREQREKYDEASHGMFRPPKRESNVPITADFS